MTYPIRGFGPNERQRERKYRSGINEYHVKDLTKHPSFVEKLNQKRAEFEKKRPDVKLTDMTKLDREDVPTKRR